VTDEPAVRVERACRDLLTVGDAVTFDAVAAHTGIGRATLYHAPNCAPSSENTVATGATRSPPPDYRSRSTNSASPWKPSPPRRAATKNNSENSTAPTEPTSRLPYPRPSTKISTD
jgi:hypothetical protein